MEPLLNTVVSVKGWRPAVIILANKCDLCHQRQVSEQEVAELQQRLHCPTIHTSASDSYNNVLQAFSLLFDLLLRNGKRKILGSSKIAQLKDTILSLTSYRSRTNTF